MKPELKPTLWRTCRVLAGRRRLLLLRILIREGGAGLSVQEIARRAELDEAAVSQELRRLQARGLIRGERRGRYSYYWFAPDESLADAVALAPVLRAGFLENSADYSDRCFRLATGLTHPRRIELLKEIGFGRRTREELREATEISGPALSRHLAKLIARGYVQREGDQFFIPRQADPLARELLAIVRPRR